MPVIFNMRVGFALPPSIPPCAIAYGSGPISTVNLIAIGHWADYIARRRPPMCAVLMLQQRDQQIQGDFENAVMQAIVD